MSFKFKIEKIYIINIIFKKLAKKKMYKFLTSHIIKNKKYSYKLLNPIS